MQAARVSGAAIALLLLLGAVAAQTLTSGGGGSGGGGGGGGGGCGGEHLACVRMASPLLTDANLVFPDNMADVNALCARWRDFVRCVKEYTGRCFSPAQQEQFVRAVQSAVGLAHRLCSEPRYQAEYLKYAFCIHSTIAENGRCSGLHQQLVERVLGEVDERPLCCSHMQFQECVLEDASRICSAEGRSAAAKSFAQELLHKTFTYIQAKCSGSEVNMQDCYPRGPEPSGRAGNRTEAGGGDGGRPGSPASQQPRSNPGPPLPPPRDEEEQSPWQPGKVLEPGPSGVAPVQSSGAGTSEAAADAADAAARLPGHGRGMAWRVSSANASQSPNPTHTWYPWGRHNNAVDEPNQQGLAANKMNNESAGYMFTPCAVVSLVATVTLFFNYIPFIYRLG